MSYLDKHMAKIDVMGKSIGESRKNETSNFINSSFTDSPFYKVVTIDGIPNIDARVEDMTSIIRSNNFVTVLNSNKYLLLRPNQGDYADLGSIVEFENSTWLMTDYNTNDVIFPKGKIERCNSTINVITGETKTKIGNDPNTGRPVYDTTPTTVTVPCIASTHQANGTYTSEINLANDRMSITVKYDDTSKLIKENDVYTLFERSYRVSSIDFTNVNTDMGFITLNVIRVVNP